MCVPTASFFIPRPGPVFDDVIFLEVQPPHAQAMVAEMQAKVCAKYCLETIKTSFPSTQMRCAICRLELRVQPSSTCVGTTADADLSWFDVIDAQDGTDQRCQAGRA